MPHLGAHLPLSLPGRVLHAAMGVLLVLGGPGHASAIDPEGTAPAVVLVVNADSPDLTFERLQPALAGALGTPVIAPPAGVEPSASAPPIRGTVTVTWRPSRRELAVTYQDARRGTVSRIVPAPADVEGAIASATELATNLVHNEAEELLGPALAPVVPAPVPAPGPLGLWAESPAGDANEAVIARAPEPAAPRPYARVVASAFFPLATNAASPEVRTRLSLNLLYGHVGQLDGMQVGLGANAVDGTVTGLQLGGGFNVAGATVAGAQTALGANYAAGTLHGIQVAGLFNRHAGGRAVQLSLGVNSAGGPVHGLQVATVNVARDVHGVQVGLVNVARRVTGLQLGLINVADDIEGIPLGLISVTKSGGVHPQVWSSTETLAALGIKLSTRYTYTLLSGAARREERDTLFGPGLAFGMRVPFLPGYFETDLGATFLFGGPLCCPGKREGFGDDVLLGRWRALFGFEVHHRFSLFGGVALTGVTRFYQGEEDVTVDLRPEVFGGVQL